MDTDGRERIFHGVNAVTKGPPWVPTTDVFSTDLSMVEKDFIIMQRLGLNVLRLGMMWPGVEPQRGNYNMSYVQQLNKIVQTAAQYGVYTLLDMHQDVLSEQFCGEGIPQWAVKSDGEKSVFGAFPAPLKKPYVNDSVTGFPTRQDCARLDWSANYGAEATGAAYQALWKNVDGIADAWANMWAFVAKAFLGQSAVLGLELINEPFPGNPFNHPEIMVPWPSPTNGDLVNMQPAYDRLNAAIRQVDTSRLLFFAGMTWDDLGVGFSQPPGGETFANRSVVAFHYYEPPQENVNLQFEVQLAAARRLQSGSMLTETCNPTCTSLFGRPGGVADGADRYLQSWANWEWKSFCRESNQTKNSTSQNGVWGACKTGYGPAWIGDLPANQSDYARTYARAVAGSISEMYFNVTTSEFRLSYNTSASCKLPTEIFLSIEYHYRNNFSVTIEPCTGASYQYSFPNLLFINSLPNTPTGTPITVVISPL